MARIAGVHYATDAGGCQDLLCQIGVPGTETVQRLAGLFILGAIVLSAVGTWLGELPGTRGKNRKKPQD